MLALQFETKQIEFTIQCFVCETLQTYLYENKPSYFQFDKLYAFYKNDNGKLVNIMYVFVKTKIF